MCPDGYLDSAHIFGVSPTSNSSRYPSTAYIRPSSARNNNVIAFHDVTGLNYAFIMHACVPAGASIPTADRRQKAVCAHARTLLSYAIVHVLFSLAKVHMQAPIPLFYLQIALAWIKSLA